MREEGIERAEVISFALKAPSAALEQMPDEVAGEIRLLCAHEGDELLLVQEDGESRLRFRKGPEGAVLTEILLGHDRRGVFFTRVLGALMARHAGDLRVLLEWSASGGSPGELELVTIRGGVTADRRAFPDVPAQNVVQSTSQELAQALATLPAAEPEPALALEDSEVELLLTRARAAYGEYCRLKRERAG